MDALDWKEGTSLVFLFIRNNEGKGTKSCCLLVPIQRDIDRLKLLKEDPSQIISSPNDAYLPKFLLPRVSLHVQFLPCPKVIYESKRCAEIMQVGKNTDL